MESDCSNRECRVLQGTGYLAGTLGVFRVVWGYFGYCGVLSGTGVHWGYCGALVVLGCTGGTREYLRYWGVPNRGVLEGTVEKKWVLWVTRGY